MKKYVLDACALFFYLEGTPAGRKVQKLLRSASEGHIHLSISAVNWAEVITSVYRTRGPQGARTLVNFLDPLPLSIQPAEITISHEAARLKGTYGLGLADAYAAATACVMEATLVTSDAAFKVVENQVEIDWL